MELIFLNMDTDEFYMDSREDRRWGGERGKDLSYFKTNQFASTKLQISRATASVI